MKIGRTMSLKRKIRKYKRASSSLFVTSIFLATTMNRGRTSSSIFDSLLPEHSNIDCVTLFSGAAAFTQPLHHVRQINEQSYYKLPSYSGSRTFPYDQNLNKFELEGIITQFSHLSMLEQRASNYHHWPIHHCKRSLCILFSFRNEHQENEITASFQSIKANNNNIKKQTKNSSTEKKTKLGNLLSTDPIVMDRREAIMAAAALAVTLPRSVNAVDTGKPLSSLEDVNLGQGEWQNQTELSTKRSSSSSIDMENTIVPVTFATYTSRFLINYDEGVSSWWDETKTKYSLLSSFEERNKLGQAFGSFSMSVLIALETFVVHQSQRNSDDNMTTFDDDVVVRERFEELADLFIEKYGGDKDGEVMRQIGILFAILPPEYQPDRTLGRFFPSSSQPSSSINSTKGNKWNEDKNMERGTKRPAAMPQEVSISHPPSLSVSYTEELADLLPPNYKCNYDTTSKSYTITPPVSLYEIGIDDEFGQNAIATLFGPLGSTPLKREMPNLSFDIYTLFGISGALGCAMTHTLVIPLDVVKTRLQTNPDRYDNILDGAIRIADSEGVNALLLGSQATIAGYLWYGSSVYPSYAFFKRYLEHSVMSPAFATSHMNDIALVAGALSAVIASFGLTPIEACRIRTVAEPEVYRDMGLLGTLKAMAEEDETMGWKALYAGLPSLLTRQVIFGSVKFLAFERACEAIFAAFPVMRETTFTALMVSLVSGAFSGALSSVVSQPADSVLTFVAKNSESKSLGVIQGCQLMIERDGVGSLFRGLGSRSLWASCIISGQFLLYDIFRNFFGVNGQDLSQVFQFVIGGQNP